MVSGGTRALDFFQGPPVVFTQFSVKFTMLIKPIVTDLVIFRVIPFTCLLYTSDAADDPEIV